MAHFIKIALLTLVLILPRWNAFALPPQIKNWVTRAVEQIVLLPKYKPKTNLQGEIDFNSISDPGRVSDTIEKIIRIRLSSEEIEPMPKRVRLSSEKIGPIEMPKPTTPMSVSDTFDDQGLLAHASLLQNDQQYFLSPTEKEYILSLIGKPLLHNWIQREFLRASHFPCLNCYFSKVNQTERLTPNSNLTVGLSLPFFAFPDQKSLEDWIKSATKPDTESDTNIEIGGSDNPFLIQNNSIYVDNSEPDLEDTRDIAKENNLSQCKFLFKNPLTEPLELPPGSAKNIVLKSFCFISASDEQIAYMLEQFKRILKPGGKIYIFKDRSPYSLPMKIEFKSALEILMRVGDSYQTIYRIAKQMGLLTTALFSLNQEEIGIILHEGDEIPGAQNFGFSRGSLEYGDSDFRA